MNPNVTPYRVLLDVSVSPKKEKSKKIQQEWKVTWHDHKKDALDAGVTPKKK
jgi:hypothetical protein